MNETTIIRAAGSMRVEHHETFSAIYLFGQLATLFHGPLDYRVALPDDELRERATFAASGW